MISRRAKFSSSSHLIFPDSMANENMRDDGENKLRVASRKRKEE